MESPFTLTVMQGMRQQSGTTGTAGSNMDIAEVWYIIRTKATILYGVQCKHCNVSYEKGHAANTLECVTPSGVINPAVMWGTRFSPIDSFVNPYAQTYAISLAGAGHTPPGDRKIKFTMSVVTNVKKAYKGECPCGCTVKCDYHEIV
jgi:hypothetical protein